VVSAADKGPVRIPRGWKGAGKGFFSIEGGLYSVNALRETWFGDIYSVQLSVTPTDERTCVTYTCSPPPRPAARVRMAAETGSLFPPCCEPLVEMLQGRKAYLRAAYPAL